MEQFTLTVRQKSAEGVLVAKAMKARTVGRASRTQDSMSDKRQKNQLVLAFTEEGRSETPKASQEGTEGRRNAKPKSRRQEQLMEEVCERKPGRRTSESKQTKEVRESTA